MRKGYVLSKRSAINWEAKTLVVVDRLKFRESLNWISKIKGVKFDSITQFSNHAILLNVQREGEKYHCFMASITSKAKAVTFAEGVDSEMMTFQLENGELRYIPTVIYKYTYTKKEILNLLNLEHSNSINLNSTIKQWNQNNILNEWSEMIQLNKISLVDLDLTKKTGIFKIDLFQNKLSENNWDIEVIKKLIANEEL